MLQGLQMAIAPDTASPAGMAATPGPGFTGITPKAKVWRPNGTYYYAPATPEWESARSQG